MLCQKVIERLSPKDRSRNAGSLRELLEKLEFPVVDIYRFRLTFGLSHEATVRFMLLWVDINSLRKYAEMRL